jgi:hypothetical protein
MWLIGTKLMQVGRGKEPHLPALKSSAPRLGRLVATATWPAGHWIKPSVLTNESEALNELINRGDSGGIRSIGAPPGMETATPGSHVGVGLRQNVTVTNWRGGVPDTQRRVFEAR